jgi:hypothetical protein
MEPLAPLTLRSRPLFQLYLWVLTILCVVAAIGLLLRAVAWLPLVGQEPSLIALLLPVVLLLASSGWMGRWAIFHSTARITVDDEGMRMESALARDALRWEEVEAIRLQATSGNEAQLAGGGHRVTFPSGSAVSKEITQQVEAWISEKLGERDLAYGDVHFWRP